MRTCRHVRTLIEDEVQDILRTALFAEPVQTVSLVEVIRSRVEPLGGIDLTDPWSTSYLK